MERRKNASAEKSKKWLANALISLMNEAPFDSISIVDISKKADLTRQTFYKHFDSKISVIEYYLDDLCELYLKYVQEQNIQTEKELNLTFFSFWADHSQFLNLLIDNNLSWILAQRFPIYLDKLTEFLNTSQMVDSGNTLKYAYLYIAGGISNILIGWIKEGQQTSVDELASLINRMHDGIHYKLV